MLDTIIEWSEREEAIRALILLGSRAGKQPVDSLSDYDLSVFCDTREPYTESEEWLIQFGEVIKEFWFEVYHVGVYLKRKDLWSVKFRSWAAHSFLLRMIEWHAQAENDWRCSTPPIGKRMSSWVSKDLWKDLHGIFAHFDVEDSWKALFNTMELFRRITAETARALRFSSMEDLSEKMMSFITTLESSQL